MADHYHDAGPGVEVVLECTQRVEVEVVRGFVEQQHIGLFDECEQQLQATSLAARQCVDRGELGIAVEPETAHQVEVLDRRVALVADDGVAHALVHVQIAAELVSTSLSVRQGEAVRDEIVQNIGRVMEPGGLGVLTTRGKDVMSAKGRPGPEPMSIITSRDTYQKGFTPTELQEYLRYILGEGFDIEPARLGPAGALIRKKAEGGLAEFKEGGHSTPAWQRKEGQNPEGGLNAAGRASYKRETGGTLKRPQPEGGPRRDSFCARMKGMKKKLTSAKTANDPDSRINKSLRKWNC